MVMMVTERPYHVSPLASNTQTNSKETVDKRRQPHEFHIEWSEMRRRLHVVLVNIRYVLCQAGQPQRRQHKLHKTLKLETQLKDRVQYSNLK